MHLKQPSMLSMMMVVSFSASVFAATYTDAANTSDRWTLTANEDAQLETVVNDDLAGSTAVKISLPNVPAGKTAYAKLNYVNVSSSAEVEFTSLANNEYTVAFQGKTATIAAGDYEVVWTGEKEISGNTETGNLRVTVQIKNAKGEEVAKLADTSPDTVLTYSFGAKQKNVEVKNTDLDNALVIYKSAFPTVNFPSLNVYVKSVNAFGKDVYTLAGKTVKNGDHLFVGYFNDKNVFVGNTSATYKWDHTAAGNSLSGAADYEVTLADVDKNLRLTVTADNATKLLWRADVVAAKEVKGLKVTDLQGDEITNIKNAVDAGVKVTLYSDADCKKPITSTDQEKFTANWYVKGYEGRPELVYAADADQTCTTANLKTSFKAGDVLCLRIVAKAGSDYAGSLAWSSDSVADAKLVIVDEAGKEVNIPQVGDLLTAKAVLADGKTVTMTDMNWDYDGTEKMATPGKLNEYLVKNADLGKKLVFTAKIDGKDVKKVLKAVGSTDEKAAVEAVSFKIWTKAYKNGIKFNYRTVGDVELDGYQIFRTTKKDGFGKSPIFTKAYPSNNFFNKTVKKGTMYYYKVRGYKVVDGETVYTQWSKVGSRKAK